VLVLLVLFEVVQPTKRLDAARHIAGQPDTLVRVFVFAEVPF
jgi:hypothetical protein